MPPHGRKTKVYILNFGGTPWKKRLFTSKEAAAYLGIKESYLRQVRMTGKIGGRMAPPPHIEIGRSIRYDKADLDRWIDSLPKRFVEHTENRCA